jgi:glycine/D-amino acid oxidase-like deaminating enzyme
VDTADTVVIGAGIVGLSTAYELARRGVPNVVVIEQGNIGAGASGKSGAIIRQHYSNPTETLLAQAGLKVFEHWADEVGGRLHSLGRPARRAAMAWRSARPRGDHRPRSTLLDRVCD